MVVGSIGGSADLQALDPQETAKLCDLLEIRLDLLAWDEAHFETAPWRRLGGLPILFTARRIEEGGALPLDASERCALLESVLEDAALIDVEVASIDEMKAVLELAAIRRIPWIASFHDFGKVPDGGTLAEAANLAKQAGAAAFKVAARVHQPADLSRLAEFQLADHGIPVATMGMGPLAPVSRLLCAQCGSVLNYGYLGETQTAPGQWDAGSLKAAIARMEPFRI